MILTIYVPAGEDTLGIAPASGIVGRHNAPDPDLVTIYYEGDLNQDPLTRRTWEERVRQAAGRLAMRYPTIARQFGIEPAKLHAVGSYDTDRWTIVEITDQAAIDAWLATRA